MKQKKILPSDLVCMNEYASRYNYQIDLAYAKADNLLFGEQIYKSSAKLWLHKQLAKIVFIAAKNCFETHGIKFVLYDGLRTTNAQAAMLKTKKVIDNPQWLEKPRLLSPIGAGGHPRAMAIDIGLIAPDNSLIDMGTDFDYLANSPHAAHNRAHREYKHSQNIIDNRNILDNAMIRAANSLKKDIILLPQEWWDFRLPSKIYGKYAPLSDDDLPENIKLTS